MTRVEPLSREADLDPQGKNVFGGFHPESSRAAVTDRLRLPLPLGEGRGEGKPEIA